MLIGNQNNQIESLAEKNKTTAYRYCEYIAMVYVTILLGSSVVVRVFFQTPFGVMSAASLLSPLWWVLSDLIAEVYGFKKARQLLVFALLLQIIFAAFFVSVIQINTSLFETNALHQKMFGHLLHISLLHAICVAIAWQINTVLLLRWKFLVRGRYFWLRSLGGSGIGLLVYAILFISISFFHVLPVSKIIELIVHSCLIKIFVLFLLAYPSQLLSSYLKRAEGLDLYEKVRFNPFLPIDAITKDDPILTTGYVNIDGKNIFYRLWQPPHFTNSVPIVIFPGGPGLSHEPYEKHTKFLTEKQPVLFFDPLGTGKSDDLENKKYTLSSYVQTAKKLVDHFKFEKIILLGTSYGGVASLQFALEYPQLIKALILVATTPSCEFFASARKMLHARGTPEQILMGERLLQGSLKTLDEVHDYFNVMGALYSMKIKEKIIVPPLINCAVEPLAYGFTHCLKTFDFREKLTNLFIPTLILCGAEDWITPVDQSKILHDLIPNSRLVVCPEAGHSIALDVPDIYRREILTFLKNI